MQTHDLTSDHPRTAKQLLEEMEKRYNKETISTSTELSVLHSYLEQKVRIFSGIYIMSTSPYMSELMVRHLNYNPFKIYKK